jgi:hypothetical protein
MKSDNNYLLRHPLCARAIVFLTIALASFTSSAAENWRWDVSGKWTINQSNNILVRLQLRQTGTVVTGTASYHRSTPPDRRLIGGKFGTEFEQGGSVEGIINASQCELRVKWGYGETGVYRGTISSDGKLSGTAYILQDPNNAARKCTWSSVYGEARVSKRMFS